MQVWVRELAEHRLPVLRGSPYWARGAGVGLFVAAFLLRWALEGILPVGLPFITFFIAILLDAAPWTPLAAARCSPCLM
jgi:hypothetical protein